MLHFHNVTGYVTGHRTKLENTVSILREKLLKIVIFFFSKSIGYCIYTSLISFKLCTQMNSSVTPIC